MKIRLHPLFIALGLLTALFGGLPVFVICALTALMHECGHVFYAARLGFTCERISLMPYGAAAVCDTEGISRADAVKLALAGPAVNAFMLVALAGLWWFFPVTYAYTDTLFSANAAMLLINLLPAYPLDGGKVVRLLLERFMSEKRAGTVLRALSFAAAAALSAVFFLRLKNLSLLVFALFLVCSALCKDAPVSRIPFNIKKPARGRHMKRVLLTRDSTYKDALRYAGGPYYTVFVLFEDGEVEEVYEEELYQRLASHTIYEKVFTPSEENQG